MAIEAITFNAISATSPSLHVLSFPIQILLQCLIACNRHSGCGGVIKYPANNFKCEFVVDPDEPGATPTTEKAAYRSVNYGSQKLFSIHNTDPSGLKRAFALDGCASPNGNLPKYPSTLKMMATLWIRSQPYFFVDLKGQTDGTLKDSEGVAADMNNVTWRGNIPLPMGTQRCIAMGYSPLTYFHFPCPTKVIGSFQILCVY